MGKKRVIAETGAGQHGVATATVCALLGLECVIYMGDVDMERQELNVLRMRLLGAEVRGVSAGSKTLKDAISEAMRDWVTNVRTTYYLLGSALGAHPYPTMVRDFHRCISREIKEQILEKEGRLPYGGGRVRGRGGSNAIGAFYEFIADRQVSADWRGGRRTRDRRWAITRCAFAGRIARGFAGDVFVRAAECGWADCADAYGECGAGLCVDWAGARGAA